MDGVALDRAGPDDRDLHHQVVQVGRLRLGQRLHLGPALDLEDADRVRGLEHPKTSGTSSGRRSRSTQAAQSRSMSWSVSSIAASMPRPSRSSLISLSVSTSRLSNWTTTRSGIVARSSGAMSISGAAVTSMPPLWIERWRGKPSMRAQNASQRSHSGMPAVEPRRISAGIWGCGWTRATLEWGSGRTMPVRPEPPGSPTLAAGPDAAPEPCPARRPLPSPASSARTGAFATRSAASQAMLAGESPGPPSSSDPTGRRRVSRRSCSTADPPPRSAREATRVVASASERVSLYSWWEWYGSTAAVDGRARPGSLVVSHWNGRCSRPEGSSESDSSQSERCRASPPTDAASTLSIALVERI